MGKKSKKSLNEKTSSTPPEPTLARRSMNRNSTMKSGRTIGEAREKLETRNERAAARKKDKTKKIYRVSFTSFAFVITAIALAVLFLIFINQDEPVIPVLDEPTSVEVFEPTIEIVDQDAGITSGKITSRMKQYVGQAESDLRELGYTPTKAVIPTGSIREVDIYLDGYTGFVKMTVDRASAVSAEDTDRLIRYLASNGINDFEYLDVRLDHQAYWK